MSTSTKRELTEVERKRVAKNSENPTFVQAQQLKMEKGSRFSSSYPACWSVGVTLREGALASLKNTRTLRSFPSSKLLTLC